MEKESFAAPYVRLGESLDAAFRRAEYAEEAFAALAVEHVERAKLHEEFSLPELARWALTSPDLPEQADPRGDFGDPPITIWRGRRFFISALVWRSSTTSIHQHAFTGAFQVLHGSSIHTRYAATEQEKITEDLALVDLSCTGIEHLTKSAVRPISSSTSGIHSLFHLEHPSVSLVVRTHHDYRNTIQYRYEPPRIAVHDQRRESQLEVMRKVAAMVASTEREAAFDILGEAIARATFYDGYQMLKSTLSATHLVYVERLIERVGEGRRPEVLAAYRDALREIVRKRAIVSRRDAVREPSLRYLMAILLNAPSRDRAIALAHAYAPERSGIDSLVAWIADLAGTTIKVQVAGVPWEPNVFGLPQPDEPSLAALAAALHGRPPTAVGELPFYRAVRRSDAFSTLFRE